MKRTAAILGVSFFLAASSHAATDVTATGTLKASIGTTFKVQYYTPDANVLYTDTIPFTNIDPSKGYALPDRRSDNDGKSDVGLYCISSDNTTWYLKITISGGNLPGNKLKYWCSQPYIWNGTSSVKTDGAVNPNPPAWTPIPAGSAATIYTSGSNDTANAPWGTLVTLSFQVDTTGLVANTPYAVQVTYTMSTTP